MNPYPNPPPASQAWLQTPLGKYFAAWEQGRLDDMLADIFGYNALQVGFEDEDLLRASRMPLHVCIMRPAPGGEGGKAASAVPSGRAVVLGDEAALPFASASLDLVVIAHALEFSSVPHQVLREAERVLVAEGSVVVCGFNPFSLWGLRRRLCARQRQWPWQGRYLSAPKVRDWLSLLGFEVQSSQFGCYAPAVGAPEWLARWKWLDRLGCRLWPVCGAAWIIHGIKRVPGARLIQPNWREKRARAESLSAVARKLGDLGGKTGETWKS